MWTQNDTTYGDILITNTLITNLLTLFSNKEAYHFELTTTMVLRAKLLVYPSIMQQPPMPIFSSIRIQPLNLVVSVLMPLSLVVSVLMPLSLVVSVLMPLSLVVSVLMPLYPMMSFLDGDWKKTRDGRNWKDKIADTAETEKDEIADTAMRVHRDCKTTRQQPGLQRAGLQRFTATTIYREPRDL